MSKTKVGPVVKIQGFDAMDRVVWEAVADRVLEYRAAPGMLAVLQEVRDLLMSHPEAKEGNAKVHYCLCKVNQAIAEAKPKKA